MIDVWLTTVSVSPPSPRDLAGNPTPEGPLNLFGSLARSGRGCPSLTQSGSGRADRLLVISDAAALIANACLEGLLQSGLPGFGEFIVHRRHASFRRALNCVKSSLAYWV